MLAEPYISRSNQPDDESVASFIERRLGKEALDYAANPFLAGIYASKPESLNLNQAFPKLGEIEKKYRSLFLGFRKIKKSKENPNLEKARLVSFPNGMEELIIKLSDSLHDQIFLEHSVQRISPQNNRWIVTFKNHKNEETDEVFDEVISTIPSHKIHSIDWNEI